MTPLTDRATTSPRPAPVAATTSGRGSPVRRVARIALGWTLLVVGGALLVLPGPGLLVIAGGLALLATEYPWAAKLLRLARQRLAALRPRRDHQR
jgi:uncharacterized protein (TIGR02611 family)